MIKVTCEKNGDADYMVKISAGEFYFSRRALIELRDKINRALSESKKDAPK